MPRPFNLKKVLAPVTDIVRKLKERRRVLQSEMDEINSRLSSFEGGRVAAKGQRAAAAEEGPAPRKRKRIRRDRASIEAEVQKIIEFIKASGKEGTTAKEIKANFHVPHPSVKAYLNQYAPKAKVKTTGNKASTRYMA